MSTSVFSIIALVLSMAGAAFAAGPSLPEALPSDEGALIVVKFVEDSDVRLRNGQLKSLSGVKLARVEKVLAAWPGLTLSRVFSRPEEDLEKDRGELKALGHDDLPDLNLFYHLRLPRGVEADQAISKLMALEMVEIAYRAPEPRPLPVSESDQGYLEAAPGGLGARQAWSQSGGTGSGVTIADVEYCWDTGHEDLSKATANKIVTYPGQSLVCPGSSCGSDSRDHGTSVLGELIADRNSFGVTGISHGSDILMSPAITCTRFLGVCLPDSETFSVADAINRAFDRLQPGDVILIEQQTDGPNYNSSDPCSQNGLVPVEWNIAEYAAIKYATGRGVTVVEAAANGQQNLDDATYGSTFDRTSRDSGAILVGAGAPPGYTENGSPVEARSRLSFSNYGSRVDVQGWGRRVATTAASSFFGSGYKTDFSGTSSASPMAAAAAAIVQAHRKALGQAVLTPLAMRDLLAGTGVRQAGTGGNIGPQVDVATAIRTLDTRPTITSASLAAPGCKGSSSRQWITFQGTGFVLASRVTLNDGTTNYDIPADRTELLDDQTPPRLRVCAGVSFAPQWTAKVKNLTYQTSDPFAFTVGGTGPSVSLTATPTSIPLGSSATLSWNSTNTTSCTASGGWSGTKATSGSQTVSPSGTTTYTLTCSNSSSTASDSETVTVTGSASPPLVLIDAFPETIAPGNSAGLAWASANATSCTASGGWSGSKPLTGSQIVNPSSTTTYTLTCAGPGGNGTDSQIVTVSSAPYVSLVARPEAISPGSSSTLFWSTVNMSSCTASGGWSGSKALSGTQTVSPSSTTTYTLTCTETSGGTSELISNGAFTGTVSQWSKNGSFFADAHFTTCHSCPGYAYLSASDGSIGASNNLAGWISQDFSIPSAATSVTLSFWVSISTQETTTTTVFDSLLVWLKDTSGNPIRTLVGLSNLDAGGYRQIFANLNPERGRTVRLEFLGATDATLGTVFRIDDVSVVANLPGAQRSDSATLTVLTPGPPTVSLTASPDSIAAGESSTLSWSSSEATSCTASGGWSGSKSLSGTQSVSPTATTTYTLTCNGAGGSASASATIALRQAAPALTLTATPSSILQGGSSNLTWNATNATSCVAAGAWEGSRPTNGGETVAPQTTSSYVLVCQGPGGSVTREATVTVIPHTVTFTSGPSGSPNPVASGGVVAMDAQATDSHGHALTWSWLSSCPGASGTFSSPASRTPTWTAPANATDASFNCLISVTASDGLGLSATASHLQAIQGSGAPAQDFFLDSSRQGCSGSGPAVLLWWRAPAGIDNVFTVHRTDGAYTATVNSSQGGMAHLVSSLLVPGQIYGFYVEGTLNGATVRTNTVTVPVISDECRLPVGTGELPHLPLAWTGTPFCSGGTASVPVQWTAVVGAASYTLTRIDNVAGQLTPYPGLAGTSMVDTGLVPGAAYEYMLDAVGSGGSRQATRLSVFIPSGICGGEPSTPGTFSAQVSTPVCDAGKGAVTLSWTPAAGATSGTNTYWSDDGFTSGSGTTFSGSSDVIDGLRPGALVKFMVQREAAATPLQYRSVILAQRVPLNLCGEGTLRPAVTTTAATYVQERQALLRASIVPNADSSIAYLEWGTSPSLGSTTPLRNAGDGYRSVSLGETLTGLTCNTTYYFRVTAANAVGQISGSTLELTTKPCTSSLPVVTLTASDPEASEQPLGNGELLIQRSGSTASDLTVTYSVGGTATVGQDHTLAGGSVVIPAGSSSKTLTVSPLDDQVAEADETVVVTLQGQASYEVGQPSSATVTIVSDEVPGGGGCGNVLVQQPRDEFGGCDTSDAGAQWRVAENFRLNDRKRISCLEVLGYYWPGNDPPPASVFDVVIHGIASDGTPGAVIHEDRAIRVNRLRTGAVSFGLEEWRFTIELPSPVELAAGDFFAEVSGAATTGGSFCWIGGQRDPVAGLSGMAFRNTGSWSLGTWDLAFKVSEAKDEIFKDGFETGTLEKWEHQP